MTDMDYTSGMVSLLGAVRKEMNGAVLDTMRYYGADYGLNYGVAIHTLREIAGRMPRNDGFARYLYLQQVRELRIIALWLAEPERLTPADFAFWGGGIINSEVACILGSYGRIEGSACGPGGGGERDCRSRGEES